MQPQLPAELAQTGDESGVPRRPLVGFCIACIAGWVIGFEFTPAPVPFLVAAAPLVALTLALARSKWSTISLLVAAMLLAIAHASISAKPPTTAGLREVMHRERESLELIGTVDDDPVLVDGREWVIQLDVEGVRQMVEWQRARGLVEVHFPVQTNTAGPAYGQRWHCSGTVFERRARPGCAPLRMTARSATYLNDADRSRFYAWCLAQRKRASAILGEGFRGGDFAQELAMMRALILGERTDIDESVHRAFVRTGTLHIVAISGGHIAVFFGLIIAVLKSLAIPRTKWVLYGAPVLIVYTAATGLSSSAVRSCIMAVVFAAAPTLRRRGDAWSSLACSALLILAVAPEQLFDAGFQLSFVAVAGLLLFHPPIYRWMLRRMPDEPMQIERPLPLQFVRWFWRATASLLAASLAAMLMTTPITAYYFNLFSPVSLVANMVIVPLASFILLSGTLSMVFGSLVPLAAEIFNHANRLFVHWMMATVETSSEWPWSYQFVRQPAIGWIVVFYVLSVAVFFAPGKWRRAAMVAGVMLIAGSAGDYFFNERAAIQWLQTGTAPVVFVDLPRGGGVLVNAGDSFRSRSLLKFLRSQGVDRLRALVVTRPVSDAMGGAADVLAEIPVDEVWVSAWHGRSKVADAFVARCRERGIPVRLMHSGSAGSFSAGVRWEALHPEVGHSYKSAAEGGVLLRLTCGGASVLFAGGGGPVCEKELLASRRDLDAEVLLAGVKQKGDLWGAGFLDAVRPLGIVVGPPPRSAIGEDEVNRVVKFAGAQTVVAERDEVWRMEFPGAGSFQWLEKIGGDVSSLWKKSGGDWWKGEVVRSDF